MRRVNFTAQFFMVLESLLPSERGGDRPSLSDFQANDLLNIEFYLMENWDKLLPSASNAYYRTMITAGRIVPSYAVRAFLRADGDIDVLDISIDWEFPLETPDWDR